MEISSSRTPSELRLRDARAGELDEVAGLLAEVYAVFRALLPARAWESYIGEIIDVRSRLGESKLIVAERAGWLVGTIGFYPDASRSALERWPQGWASIRALGVRAGARRQGVGTALARECLRRAREHEARAIGLHTASHMAAATRLYERWAFAAPPSSTSRSARCSPAGRCRRARAGRRGHTDSTSRRSDMTKQCVLVQAGEAAEGKTGVTYAAGVSASSAGATGLCLQLASLPPGARARAHQHDEHESAAYLVEGEMAIWFGERLEQKLVARPGDFVYIPGGVPHLVMNGSQAEPAVAVLARTDPNEQEDVTALPGLDALPRLRAERLT